MYLINISERKNYALLYIKISIVTNKKIKIKSQSSILTAEFVR